MEFFWEGKHWKLNVKNFLEIEELRDKIIAAAEEYKQGFLDTNGDVDYAEEKFDDWLYSDNGVNEILNEYLDLKAHYSCSEEYEIYSFIISMI